MTPLTIHEAAAAIRAGALTPVDLLEQCLERIDRYEPHVRAWVLVDRDGAREQALRLTDELKKGQNRGPLHGIPIGVKDIIDVFDLPTGCGSKLWANSIARQDATVVKRLRQAGAVILGKTVTTAFAFLDPPVTRNPWNLDRTPGGSSSGSAAAVACGMCLGALASQTGGSTTRPAAFCGVCSLKPPHGAIPVDGVLPLAPSLDHMGLMARCVEDLQHLFAATSIFYVPAWPNSNVGEFVRLTGALEERVDPDQRACLDRVEDAIHLAGELVARIAPPPGFSEVCANHRTVLAAEAAAHHAERLRRHPDDYPPKIRELVEEGVACPAPDLVRCRRHREELREVCDGLFPNRPLLTPAALGVAPEPDTTGDAFCNAPWSYLGPATISLPCGHGKGGLPLAVQLVGDWTHASVELFVAARWLEGLIDWKNELPPVPA
jgi:aspartyl-tRNA(Asn)/glutamyl-tRNA(Gln) amidotransferase subunit A